ncbi:MAG TPA: CoA transferase [Candidatus Angelobacter sp.]|nr:CoA transferase [Candidatus Angelobacter sp.]
MAQPLKGLRVIDLTKDFAGPFCTMILSEMGAEVIKVEKPVSGDETRAWGPPFVKGLSYYFLSLNRGKKSITLDLKTFAAQKVVRQLVQDSDILVESFRPGTLAQLKLDYPRLRRVNKALVYCSISGFGQTGPYRDRPGYDLVAFAMSGIMSTTGEEGRPSVRVSIPVADIAAGHYASTAILACLSRRLVTGRGEYIDISLYDSIVSWLSYLATYYFATGKEPKRMGSAHPSIVPYQAFNCKDKELIIAVGNDSQWQALCRTLGLERLLEEKRFRTNPDRVRNRTKLIPILSKRLRNSTASYWSRVLNHHGVPSAPVYKIADMVRDPQIMYRGLFRSARSDIPQLISPIRFINENNGSSSPAPKLGQDTQKVLQDIGYSKDSIRRLGEDGTI